MALATDREILTLQTAAATCKNTSIDEVQKRIAKTTVMLTKKFVAVHVLQTEKCTINK